LIEKGEYFEDFNVDINWLYICIQLSPIYIYNWTTNQSFVVVGFFLVFINTSKFMQQELNMGWQLIGEGFCVL
jgi:hypothetical protein